MASSRLFARPWLADPDLLDHVPLRFVALLTSRQPAGAVASRLQQTAAAGFRQSRSHVITMPAMPRSRAATALFSASSAIRASSVLMCSRQVRDLLEVETGQIPDPYLSVR